MMMYRSNRTKLRAMALAGALVAGAACSSDAVEDAEDTGEDVSEEIDESAEDIDEASGDLASVLEENGLENMASAVEQIDITELVGTEEFTFFAPGDDAFQSLGADDIADVLTDPDQLVEVLRRHAVSETIDAAALAEMDSIETVGETTLEVTVEGDTVMVGGATVTTTDIEVDNGVVHVVDTIFIDA